MFFVENVFVWNFRKKGLRINAVPLKFVLSSDAHCADDVGEMTNALEFVRQYNIPLDRIVNLSCQDLEK